MKRTGIIILAVGLAMPWAGRAETSQNPTVINTFNNSQAAAPQAPAAPRPKGKVVFKDLWSGLLAGSTVGLSAGLYAYGLSKNYDSDQIHLGLAYGMVSGALLGTCLGFMELSEAVPLGTGANFGKYVAAGAGSGMMLGAFAAAIPYIKDRKNDRNFYYGAIGAGLGGLIGGGLGIIVALIDTAEPETAASAGPVLRFGCLPEDSLKPFPAEAKVTEPEIACRVVEIKF